jgi:tRNA(fMet)-specific endonuclease VapC
MPPSGRFLLDTNIIIGLLNGEEAVRKEVESAGEVFIPVVALGELYFGAAKSSRPRENRTVIDRFIEGRFVLNCDLEIAKIYGDLKVQLKAQGTPLPENDIWIAQSQSAMISPL